MEECPICAFSYNKTKYKKIICKFCSKDACSNCMQQYILSMLEDGDPKCLYCKNIFTFEYLNQIFNKNFLNKKYRLKRIEYLYASIPLGGDLFKSSGGILTALALV